MWAIKYCPGYKNAKGEWEESYFKGILFGLREYGFDGTDAMKFKTKREAQKYIRVMLYPPEKHHAVRVLSRRNHETKD